jgi:DNA-binding FadR family transcriptional regulator
LRAATIRSDFSTTGAGSPRSHTAHVMREIGMAIVSGHYPQHIILPGDAELMEQFKVSRTVLREAMKMLAGKGLIQAKARIGTRVRDRSEWNMFDADVLIWYAANGVDAQFITSLGEMRLALEPQAAALAAQRRTAVQLEAIYRGVAVMEAAKFSADDFAEGDLAFHLAISAAAANPFMSSVSTFIEVALITSLKITSPMDDQWHRAQSVAWHRAIADAIAAKDSEAARAGMIVVIEDGIRGISRKREPTI